MRIIYLLLCLFAFSFNAKCQTRIETIKGLDLTKKSLLVLNKLCKQYPTWDTAIYLRACVNQANGNCREAIEDCNKIKSTSVFSIKMLYVRGLSEFTIGDFINAREDLNAFRNELDVEDNSEVAVSTLYYLVNLNWRFNDKGNAKLFFDLYQSKRNHSDAELQKALDNDKAFQEVIQYSNNIAAGLDDEYSERNFDESIDMVHREYLKRDPNELKYKKIGTLSVMTTDLISDCTESYEDENGYHKYKHITKFSYYADYDEPLALANLYEWRIPTKAEMTLLMKTPESFNLKSYDYYLFTDNGKYFLAVFYGHIKHMDGDVNKNDFKVRLVKN